MKKKVTVITVISSFVFILLTTAWDYCPPKPGHHLTFSTSSLIHGNQFKAAHPPCTSLKDAYEVLSFAFNITPSVVKHILPPSSVTMGSLFSVKYLSNFYARPPPLAPPSAAGGLFQLYCNLRI